MHGLVGANEIINDLVRASRQGGHWRDRHEGTADYQWMTDVQMREHHDFRSFLELLPGGDDALLSDDEEEIEQEHARQNRRRSELGLKPLERAGDKARRKRAGGAAGSAGAEEQEEDSEDDGVDPSTLTPRSLLSHKQAKEEKEKRRKRRQRFDAERRRATTTSAYGLLAVSEKEESPQTGLSIDVPARVSSSRQKSPERSSRRDLMSGSSSRRSVSPGSSRRSLSSGGSRGSLSSPNGGIMSPKRGSSPLKSPQLIERESLETPGMSPHSLRPPLTRLQSASYP